MARRFLEEHPEIPHSWRQIRNASGGRTDLVCWPETAQEIYASLSNYQITIGAGDSDRDFEDFGRGLSDKEVAQEAFSYFETLIREKGLKEIGSV